MIIILTQCFPSRVGGIETLMYDIALNLSHKHDVKVLADQQDSAKDLEFDKNNKNFSILRFKGLKFLRKRKKSPGTVYGIIRPVISCGMK